MGDCRLGSLPKDGFNSITFILKVAKLRGGRKTKPVKKDSAMVESMVAKMKKHSTLLDDAEISSLATAMNNLTDKRHKQIDIPTLLRASSVGKLREMQNSRIGTMVGQWHRHGRKPSPTGCLSVCPCSTRTWRR